MTLVVLFLYLFIYYFDCDVQSTGSWFLDQGLNVWPQQQNPNHRFCCCSVAQSRPTLGNPMDCSTPGLPVHHQLMELAQVMSIESVMPSNHLILCHPHLLSSIFPSFRVFSNESVLPIRWPKYWSFSFSISPSNVYTGLISPCCPRDSQESSPALQFKSINSLVLSLLCGPTLTFMTTGKTSFNYMDLCWQSDVSAF